MKELCEEPYQVLFHSRDTQYRELRSSFGEHVLDSLLTVERICLIESQINSVVFSSERSYECAGRPVFQTIANISVGD